MTTQSASTARAAAAIEAMHDAEGSVHVRAARRRACPLPFALHAIEQLLSRTAVAHTQAWHVWVPRLAVTMGLRASEASMLQTTDLERHHDRWFLRIARGPHGPLRGPLCRLLPVPRPLEEAGFVIFLHSASPGPLFPTLARRVGGASAVHRWVKRCAATEPAWALSYRDLRQACARALHNDGAAPYVLNAYLGRRVSPMTLALMGRFYAWGEPLMLLAMVDDTHFPYLKPAS